LLGPGGAGHAADCALAVQEPRAVRPAARLDPHQWRWLIRFLRNCDAERFTRNKARMQRIAHYSKACLGELRRRPASLSITAPAADAAALRTEEELAGAEKIRACSPGSASRTAFWMARASSRSSRRCAPQR
jgi:D-amino-acid dehydrogenase